MTDTDEYEAREGGRRMTDTDEYEARELEQMIHDAGYPECGPTIDEDKYEGHTEGPWEVLCGPELVQEAHEYDMKWAKPHKPDGGDKMGIGHLNLFFLKTPFNNAIPDYLEDDFSRGSWAEGYAMEWFAEEAANAQLMADAPLLLAEVKRLRAENEELRTALLGVSGELPRMVYRLLWSHDLTEEE